MAHCHGWQLGAQQGRLVGVPESHFGSFMGPPQLPSGMAVRLQEVEAGTGSLVQPRSCSLLEFVGFSLIPSAGFQSVISGPRTFFCVRFLLDLQEVFYPQTSPGGAHDFALARQTF